MRIAISGTANVGKSTFLKDFLKEWPDYTTPTSTVRDILENSNHSKTTTKDVQWNILNFMIDQVMEYSKDDYIIFDRSLIDNLVYSMWSFDKEDSDIDEEFIGKSIELAKEAVKLYDVIFFIPITKASPVEIVKDGTRETDPHYIKEIDSLFKAIEMDWNTNPECKFCDPQDRPALIEIFGNERERIEMAKLYIDMEGDAITNTNIMDELGNIKSDGGISLPYQ